MYTPMCVYTSFTIYKSTICFLYKLGNIKFAAERSLKILVMIEFYRCSKSQLNPKQYKS